MKLIDHLRNMHQRHPNKAGYTPLVALCDTWEALPKLLAVVEAAKTLDKAFSFHIDQSSDVNKLRKALTALEEEV